MNVKVLALIVVSCWFWAGCSGSAVKVETCDAGWIEQADECAQLCDANVKCDEARTVCDGATKTCRPQTCDDLNTCFAGVSCEMSGETYQCGACPANHTGDGEDCTPCDPGTYNTNGGTCRVQVCVSLTPENSATSLNGPDGQSATVICNDGYSGGGQWICNVPDHDKGTWVGMACTACPPGRFSTNGATCVSCPDGKYASGEGNTSCKDWSECGDGLGVVTNPSAIADTSCEACGDSGWNNQTDNDTPCNCNPGYTSYQGRCTAEDCEATQVPHSTTYTETRSLKGKTGDSVDVICADGYQGSATVTCIGATGSFSDVSCSACDAGTYSTGGESCQSCVAGEYAANPGTKDCIACGAGSVTEKLNATGATACTACDPGDYSTASTRSCSACGAGSVTEKLNATGATTCTACGAGTYSTASITSCVACGAGSVDGRPNGTGGTACKACSAGTYSNGAKTSCVTCGAGSVTDKLNATGAGSCTACSAGTYSTASTTSCIACAAGSATDKLDEPGATSCTACRPGYYNTNGGPCEGIACTDVTVSDSDYSGTALSGTTGQTKTVTCNAGYSVRNSIVTPTEVTAGGHQYHHGCNNMGQNSAGDFIAVGSQLYVHMAYQVKAAGGWGPLSPIMTRPFCSATKHGPNFVKPANWDTPGVTHTRWIRTTDASGTSGCEVLQAPVGSSSDYTPTHLNKLLAAACSTLIDTSTLVQSAPTTATWTCGANARSAGTWTGGACGPCAPGTYRSNASATMSCDQCRAGSVNPEFGQLSCTNCAAGQYSTASTSSCIACGAGSVTDALNGTGASTCTACSAGEYSTASTTPCIACATGSVTDRLQLPGAISCNACEAGTFSSTHTMTCTNCTNGKYSSTSGSSHCAPWTTCDPATELRVGENTVNAGTCQPACAPFQVAYSDKGAVGSIPGGLDSATVDVTCESGYSDVEVFNESAIFNFDATDGPRIPHNCGQRVPGDSVWWYGNSSAGDTCTADDYMSYGPYIEVGTGSYECEVELGLSYSGNVGNPDDVIARINDKKNGMDITKRMFPKNLTATPGSPHLYKFRLAQQVSGTESIECRLQYKTNNAAYSLFHTRTKIYKTSTPIRTLTCDAASNTWDGDTNCAPEACSPKIFTHAKTTLHGVTGDWFEDVNCDAGHTGGTGWTCNTVKGQDLVIAAKAASDGDNNGVGGEAGDILRTSSNRVATSLAGLIDGVIDNDYDYHSNGNGTTDDEFITLDLTAKRYVESIKIWNRTGCCNTRISDGSGTEVWTSTADDCLANGSGATRPGYTHRGVITSSASEIDFTLNIDARCIMLFDHSGDTTINLSELDVTGHLGNTAAMVGAGCAAD